MKNIKTPRNTGPPINQALNDEQRDPPKKVQKFKAAAVLPESFLGACFIALIEVVDLKRLKPRMIIDIGNRNV